MAVLGNDDLCAPPRCREFSLPLPRVGVVAGVRRSPFQVVVLAEYEHDDVGVLLDVAGGAQIAELRSMVVARVGGAIELRDGDHRHG